MKREDLNKWAFPHDKLPRKLFFVHHAGSQCRFIEEREREEDCPDDLSIDELSLSIMGGITAASPDGIIGCIDELTNVTEIYRKIKRHLYWSNRGPSCFVSTFSDGNDALRWGLQLDGTVKIYTVDTSTTRLPPMPMIHA
ncbi:hypothetical protein B0H65DRAFT_590145 [Neurospora tetraspora]|uniref:DUF7587 domain-containing protein n=1 Tax=Neurospora tetraspora TaxID=94610 RepID=A0AAE0JDY7_9PEZI|nr:hypothetical protein B0H65DRAFT_590145 [Neurospora tetraspora]